MNTDSLLRSLAMDGMGRRGHTWRGIKKKSQDGLSFVLFWRENSAGKFVDWKALQRAKDCIRTDEKQKRKRLILMTSISQ